MKKLELFIGDLFEKVDLIDHDKGSDVALKCCDHVAIDQRREEGWLPERDCDDSLIDIDGDQLSLLSPSLIHPKEQSSSLLDVGNYSSFGRKEDIISDRDEIFGEASLLF